MQCRSYKHHLPFRAGVETSALGATYGSAGASTPYGSAGATTPYGSADASTPWGTTVSGSSIVSTRNILHNPFCQRH